MRKLALGLLLTLVAAAGAAQSLAERVDAIAASAYRSDEPGAVVLVAKDGKPILRKAYGMADLEQGVPLRPDMPFRLGSITKQFTAVAVLQLVHDGKLSLDDELTKVLPDFPTQGRKVTIRQLLTHTSGIHSYTSVPTMLQDQRRHVSPADLLATFRDAPFDFEPGTRWSYDNSGYILLGAIVEKLSGQPWRDYLAQHLFTPLGMTHTAADDEHRILPGRVRGYARVASGYINAPYIDMTYPYAAGSLVSTIDDLLLWDEALYAAKPVARELLETAWTPAKLADGRPTKYAFGWIVRDWSGHRVIEHGGGISGFATAQMRVTDQHLLVTVLSNNPQHQPSPGFVAAQLAAAVLGLDYPAAAIPTSDAELDKLAGTYAVDANTAFTLVRDGGVLVLTRSDAPPAALLHRAGGEYSARDGHTVVRFTTDASGIAKALELDDYPDAPVTARRQP